MSQAENKKPADFFFEAFYRVITRVNLPAGTDLDKFCLSLKEAFESGDPRKSMVVVRHYLDDKTWNWPDFVMCFPDDQANVFKSMQLLELRINLMTYSLFHREKSDFILKMMPYWRISAKIDESCPDECRRLNGIVKHYSDVFWVDYYPPHKRVDCACGVIALTPGMLKSEVGEDQFQRIINEPIVPTISNSGPDPKLLSFVNSMRQFERDNKGHLAKIEAASLNKPSDNICAVQSDPNHQKRMDLIIPILQLNPGILQTEVYKQLSSHPKDELSLSIYTAEKYGQIKREKKGRTYALFVI